MAQQEADVAALDAARQKEWEEKVALVQQQEDEAMEAASLPLRNFLMKHVMPTLTKGLMEVCQARPDDPLDYLAEYLFEKNPQLNV